MTSALINHLNQLSTNPDPWLSGFSTWLKNIGNQHTMQAYWRDWREFMAFAAIDHPAKVDTDMVVNWRNKLEKENGWQETTIARKLSSLSSYYVWAIENKITDANPVDKVKRPIVSPYGKAQWLEDGQDKQLLASIERNTYRGKRDYALILLLMITAGRRMIIASDYGDYYLQHSQIKNGYITFPLKGGSDKRLALPKLVLDALTDYFAVKGNKRGVVFTHADGMPLEAQDINKILEQRGNAIGIEGLSPHWLRHTALRKAIATKKYDPNELRSLSGHKNLRTLLIYIDNVTKDASSAIVEDLANSLGDL